MEGRIWLINHNGSAHLYISLFTPYWVYKTQAREHHEPGIRRSLR